MSATRRRLGRLLVLGAIVLAVTVSVGGGATYVALTVTTKPEFCATCHIMEPYVESWRASSHSDVPCVDCHYEPGLLETFEGKFKALSQLAKYVTATEGTKPWAEVSDASCMRSGCHSNRLLEGEITFGRIRFDHRHHLIGLRRGKRLRCTSCHSQIVQGEHVTVTPATCILCHFRESPSKDAEPIADCRTCHGPPTDDISLGGLTFRHSDYLARGVDCGSCHGDVTRGTGDVPRARCGSCHNQEQHLDRYGDVDFLHRMHVTEHSVNCLECHTEIEHGLPPRDEHYQGACSDCHVDTHQAPSGLYRGTGGLAVPDDPSVMFLARVTCTGCHRPPFAGAPTPLGGATWTAEPLSCLYCHGPGYEGMMDRWQGEIRTHTARVRDLVESLHEALTSAGTGPTLDAARRAHANAAHNLGLVLLDRSEGVHNMPYARSLLRQAVEDARAGFAALDPDSVPPTIPIGPRVASEWQCTTLCHVGVEQRPLDRAFGRPFPHARHVLEAGLDCSRCHGREPHGTTTLQPAGCAACHHPEADDAEQCAACHQEVAELRGRTPEDGDPSPMADFDCLTCHESIADGHSLAAVQELCYDCHEDEVEGLGDPRTFYAAWAREALTALAQVEERLGDGASEGDVEVRKALEALRRAGPFHNPAWAREQAARWLERLGRDD